MCFMARKALALGLGGNMGDLKFVCAAIVDAGQNVVVFGSGGKDSMNA